RRRRARDPHLPKARARVRRAAQRLGSRRRGHRHRPDTRCRSRSGRGVGLADPIRHRPGRSSRVTRAMRVAATLIVTGLCTAYILWKIDLGKTGHVLAHARLEWWLAALAIMVGSVWPMAWRWQRLLAARGVHDSLRRLVRPYF